jgi:hypothetical protein
MKIALFLVPLVAAPRLICAQDPTLALDDLKYSREAFEKNHLIAQVDVATRTPLHYRYDRYAEVRRIVMDDGVEYAQPKGKSWRKSKDWGKTGAIIKGDKAAELDNKADVAEVAFSEPVTHDASQGGFVWQFIDKGQESDIETYTYEQSREHPRPNGVYPRYTFVKYKNDTDGKLLLYRFTGQLRSGNEVIPIRIQYGLMIIMPADSIKIVEPEKSRKK